MKLKICDIQYVSGTDTSEEKRDTQNWNEWALALPISDKATEIEDKNVS